NTVVNRDGKLYGWNTDYMRFAHLCRSRGITYAARTVVLLGTGGTPNTAAADARHEGAGRGLTASRRPDPAQAWSAYEDAVRSAAQVVITTTPAWLFPYLGPCLLDVAAMPGLEAVVDVVYNPARTELLLRAEEAGIPVTACGLEMLVAQAVWAAEYFLDKPFADREGEIRRSAAALRRDILNVSLVGMPSSGKTTLGRALAAALGRPFVDLDEEIVRADGRSIPEIFAAEGEEGFRARETEQVRRFGRESGLLL